MSTLCNSLKSIARKERRIRLINIFSSHKLSLQTAFYRWLSYSTVEVKLDSVSSGTQSTELRNTVKSLNTSQSRIKSKGAPEYQKHPAASMFYGNFSG
jgi:hypothetical protein